MSENWKRESVDEWRNESERICKWMTKWKWVREWGIEEDEVRVYTHEDKRRRRCLPKGGWLSLRLATDQFADPLLNSENWGGEMEENVIGIGEDHPLGRQKSDDGTVLMYQILL